jgi:autotransporter-associated beta strand protein
MAFSWSRWLRSLLCPRVATYRKARPPRRRLSLSLEPLELRLAPATYVWNGLGGSNNDWSNGANWVGGQAPTGALDDLIFGPAAATNARTTVDDLNPPGGATFNSITFQASGYTIKGVSTSTSIVLGTVSSFGSGYIVDNAGSLNETITANVALGGPPGSDQFFNVGVGASLSVTGKLTGNTGSFLTKEGAGTLTLTGTNSGFTGGVKIDQGIVIITSATALGSNNETIVATNAQLAVQSVSGTITEPVILNGPGPANNGALLSLSGNNVWAGTITLDSDTTFGAGLDPGTTTPSALDITGTITDLGAGYNVTKEGQGQIIFAASDSYRGSTTVNNGILTIENADALGTVGNVTTVNQTLTKVGTLQIDDPNNKLDGGGFTVLNEQLVLNGTGVTATGTTQGLTQGGFLGALDNVLGNNQWAGPVTLGSPPPTVTADNAYIGVAQGTSLIISGVVQDQPAPATPPFPASSFSTTATATRVLPSWPPASSTSATRRHWVRSASRTAPR